MYDLPHKLVNNLGLMILRNEELLSLFTGVFIDLMIREFELVARRLNSQLNDFNSYLINWNL